MTGAIAGVTGSLIRLTSAFTPAGAQASRFASGMTQGVSGVTRMTRSLGGLSAAAGGGVAGVAALASGIAALSAVAITAGGALGILVAGVGALIVLFKTAQLAAGQLQIGLQLAGQSQLDVLSFQAMTGSLAEATRIMGKLRDESKRTGAELAGSASTVKRFLALGFEANAAIKLNKSILDVAGSIGLSTQEAKLLGVALAQVQSLGTVGMEELRTQIAEKGVPIMQELANKVAGGSIALMRKYVSEGKIASKELIDIFLNLEGSFARFAGGAERMTQTLPGAIDRLKANWKSLLVTAATPLAASMVPALNAASDKLGEMTDKAKAIGEALASGFRTAVEILKSGEAFQAIHLGFAAAKEWLWNALGDIALEIYNTIGQAFEDVVNAFKDGMTKVIEELVGILKNPLKAFGPGSLATPPVDVFKPKDLPSEKEQGAQDKLREFLDRFNKTSAPPPLPDVPVPPTGENPKIYPEPKKPEPIELSAVEKLSLAWGDLDKQLDDLAAGSLTAVRDGMTDALMGIINGTMSAKEAFTKMATSIIQDITRMIIKMMIQLAIQKALEASGYTSGVVKAVPVGQTGGGSWAGVFGSVVGSAASSYASSSASSGGGSSVGGAKWGQYGEPLNDAAGAQFNAGVSGGGSGLPSGGGGGIDTTLFGGNYHAGGLVGAGQTWTASPQRIEMPKFHSGGMASSEEIVKVEKGETVLTRRRASEIEAELEASRDGGRRKSSNDSSQSATIINVFDRAEIADIVATNPDAVLNALSRRLPAVRKLVMGGNRL
jgi:tape measure domain-containing protein